VAAETSLAHAALSREHGERKIAGEIATHPIMQGAEAIVGKLQRKRRAELRLPAGPIFSHISFQSYERGDFRIFNKTIHDNNIMRPKGFNGENPVYDPGNYETGSPLVNDIGSIRKR
jgi:hypothetical protein